MVISVLVAMHACLCTLLSHLLLATGYCWSLAWRAVISGLAVRLLSTNAQEAKRGMQELACPLQRFGGHIGQPCGLLLVWKGCTRSAPSCHLAQFEKTCKSQQAELLQDCLMLRLSTGTLLSPL